MIKVCQWDMFYIIHHERFIARKLNIVNLYFIPMGIVLIANEYTTINGVKCNGFLKAGNRSSNY